MVSNPEQWVDDFAKAGASGYTFHVEAADDAAALVSRIKELGMVAGIAIKPDTPVEAIMPLLPVLDMVLVMTVEPGFGGQSFMEDMMRKVKAIRAAAPDLHIQVDGGISPATAGTAIRAGANVLVAGTAVFKAPSSADAITALRYGGDGGAAPSS